MIKVTSGSDYKHSDRLPQSSDYLNNPIYDILCDVDAKKILDIGCGNGALAKYLIDRNINVVGMEPSESGIANARIILPNVKFYVLGCYDDPQKIEENNFDAVISTEVIEHLYYPRELLRFAKAKLKPGGILILTTPYHGYIKNLILSIMGKWDAHHTSLWDGGHIKFWSKTTLTYLMEEEGFEVRRFVGCGRIPYIWKSMLLSGQLKEKQ